jgi:hypothetical protein
MACLNFMLLGTTTSNDVTTLGFLCRVDDRARFNAVRPDRKLLTEAAKYGLVPTAKTRVAVIYASPESGEGFDATLVYPAGNEDDVGERFPDEAKALGPLFTRLMQAFVASPDETTKLFAYFYEPDRFLHAQGTGRPGADAVPPGGIRVKSCALYFDPAPFRSALNLRA